MYIYIFFRKWLLWSFGAVERKNPMVISLSQMMSHLHQAFAPSAESLSMPAGTLFAGATPGPQSFVRYQFGRWSLKRSEKMKVAGEEQKNRDLPCISWSDICTELQWFLEWIWVDQRIHGIFWHVQVARTESPRAGSHVECWCPRNRGTLECSVSRVFHWSESRGWWIRPRAGWGNLDFFFFSERKISQ